MLRDRLLSSSILIAAVTALLVLDARYAPSGGKGLLLLPALLLFALGTAWDVTGLFQKRGVEASRRWGVLGSGIVASAAILPTVTNLAGVRTLELGIGSALACVVVAAVAVIFGFLLVEMVHYQPGSSRSPVVRWTAGVTTIGYVGLPMSLLVATRLLNVNVGNGNWGLAALLSLIAITKVADAGAYFTGRAFGRTKLIPRLSPGKTREGAIGGVMASTIVAAICLAYLFPWIMNDGGDSAPHILWAILLGPLLAVSGMLGDLAESLVKRDCGAKDSGAWLPGLGGMWDVTDSLIFATMPGFLCFAAAA